MHSRPFPHFPTPRRMARAYTVVEVMLSLTMLAIGASAVISMQKAALQANLDARKTDLANAIARMWVERIRRDAMQWTLPSPAAAGTNFANAQLLSTYVTKGWQLPTVYAAQTPPISPRFDALGRDIATGAATPTIFCVNIQETYIDPANSLIRADVRVLWLRGINPGATDPCSQATTVLPNPQLYQSLYMTTVVESNALP
jgi:Tfp pilus assembly protein PilV